MHFYIIHFLFDFVLESNPLSCDMEPSLFFISVVIHMVQPIFHGFSILESLCILALMLQVFLLGSGLLFHPTMNLR
jgi:hypothetical protein